MNFIVTYNPVVHTSFKVKHGVSINSEIEENVLYIEHLPHLDCLSIQNKEKHNILDTAGYFFLYRK